ncbi:protein-disulfide reductase DsbD domain-containing protein [Edaphobacter modestus]|uniref:Disulfide bond corrector protein DsbC n=1 Tax=Edaphobacter modestus TaxID=388466 RepID=A0A4Q7Z1I0_9BACT|nr:protein-disulfide reductase DsbD domain-containing protein [Edaphobacter modestus]RZU43375.1 disulfide bond corrector protein DsbC [Edaphobacter modestus]
MIRAISLRALLVFGLASGCALAQQVNLSAPPAKTKQYVSYAAEEQNLSAGKKSVVELRFHVTDGFHVNSHTPKSELLIPTKLTLDPAQGVKAAAAEYPAGTAYSFSFEPNEKLDVYTGAFTVKVPVVAEAGPHTVNGVLHYQACDNAACYPPKSLPVQVVVTAK